MRNTFDSSWRRRMMLICTAIGVGFIFPHGALAPPRGGGGRPAPGRPPARKPGGPVRPGPKARPPRHVGPKVLPPRGKPLPHRAGIKRFVRRPRYWHPRYPLKTPAPIWPSLGYPYYVGGTDYVVVTPPAETSEQAPQALPVPGPGDTPTDGTAETGSAVDRYEQIQELTDLVHEWRTMNESPSVHQRLPSSGESQEARSLFAAIRQENQRFDQAARSAMRELARGQPAGSSLESAREHLARLIELVEALPESPEPGESPTAR